MSCYVLRAAMAESVKAVMLVSQRREDSCFTTSQGGRNFLTSRGDGEWEQPLGNDRMGLAHHASHQVPDRLNRVD